MRGATGGPPQGRGKTRHFNPRTPRGVRLDKRHLEPPPELEFQSTRPMRGATRRSPRRDTSPRDFNPRAPCGARRHPQSHPAGSGAISIHAPHAGRDDFSNASQVGGALFQSTRPVRARRSCLLSRTHGSKFQSTRPVRGATLRLAFQIQKFYISIHAPRAGRDCRKNGNKNLRKEISIHAPRAGRDPGLRVLSVCILPFQSTRPVRGATS